MNNDTRSRSLHTSKYWHEGTFTVNTRLTSRRICGRIVQVQVCSLGQRETES
jgi:hypothetical protein